MIVDLKNGTIAGGGSCVFPPEQQSSALSPVQQPSGLIVGDTGCVPAILCRRYYRGRDSLG
jgi:hypothetical protein